MKGGAITVPDIFPVVNMTPSIMVLPSIGIEAKFASPSHQKIIEDAREDKCPMVLAVMSFPGIDKEPDRFYRTGIISELMVDNNEYVAFLFGSYRARVIKWLPPSGDNDYWRAQTSFLADAEEEYFVESKSGAVVIERYRPTFKAIMSEIKRLMTRIVERSSDFDIDSDKLAEILNSFDNYDFDYRVAIDRVVWGILASLPDVTPVEKQAIIESNQLEARLGGVLKLLTINLAIAEGKRRLQENEEDIKKAMPDDPARRPDNKNKEGGDDEDAKFLKGVRNVEITEKYKRYAAIKQFMNEDARKSILDSFKRLKSIGQARGDASGSEWTVFMTHIDFMLELPWNSVTEDESDINKVEKLLDDEHYGLKSPKTSILRYLAGKILNPERKGGILCFAGPPGVGKTSLANSIAGAQGRKLVRLSLGGLRDEAEIRGHRKTYVGALAGQIMQEIRRAGVKNPVFVLDEIDKITRDFRGDPSAALLEVLDPEQNHSFRDHYLDAPFDLSQVFFICTANIASNMRPALKDRMEVINLPGYTTQEKVEIAKRFLIPKALINEGLAHNKIELNWADNNPDALLFKLARDYTKEAGVRNLERLIKTICQQIGCDFLKDRANFSSPAIDWDFIVKTLGQPRYLNERAKETGFGEVIGLAWTQFGGDILYVQARILPEFRGKELSQTGLPGSVMKEANKVALSLLRVELEKKNKSDVLEGKSIHIHIPEGAVPKDGPSAGITTFCSLYSAAFKKLARPLVAMTGEITLAGNVTAVGGIKEKVIAAENAGIREVILPKSNQRDLDDVPKSAKENLTFHFVESIGEVLDVVFKSPAPVV